ncbi:hypothetical protein MRB53_031489 [Persea americana]|uniref:Uncharacterized protein n=1 Tax=Persea americana TaxID=3435 RepID=A0ACC2KPK5_PERAE|nr:hypothetical protein MRB53_031489 [Persea americana]
MELLNPQSSQLLKFGKFYPLTEMTLEEKVGLSQPHVLEQAADYIKKMEERINELRSRKEYLTTDRASEIIDTNMSGAMMINSTRTMVEVSESGSALNVVLISSLNKDVKLSDVITTLEEEGTEVLSTNQYFVADKCHRILLSQAKSSRVGYDIERIHKRLAELVQ